MKAPLRSGCGLDAYAALRLSFLKQYLLACNTIKFISRCSVSTGKLKATYRAHKTPSGNKQKRAASREGCRASLRPGAVMPSRLLLMGVPEARGGARTEDPLPFLHHLCLRPVPSSEVCEPGMEIMGIILESHR